MGTGTIDLLKAVTLNQDEPPFAWDLLLGDSPMNHPYKKQALLEAAIELFAKDGWKVIIHYNNSKADAEALADSINAKDSDTAFIVQGDLDKANDVKNIISKVDGYTETINLLINNASTFYPKKITDIDSNDWDKLMSSNLKTPIFLVSALAEKLIKNNGHIVNITDIYAEQGMSGYSVYAAAKAGLYNLTKSLARELAPNVLVNSISPGSILWDVNEPSEEKKKKILDSIPMKRLGSEKDIVMLADYLITKNTYMTGRNISVDGGKSLG